MNKLKDILTLIMFVGFAININSQNIPANSPVGINGQLRVIGTKLCNQYGNPIQLRGMSTHGLQWFYNDCYSNTKINAFNTLRDWGADILRISMYVQEGGYETNPALFTQRVKALIDIATDRGMYALIDFHQLNPGDPNYNIQRARTFFTEIATTYKDYPNILYDICNEPNSGSGGNVTWSVIKTYADQIIPLIRNIDNDAVITVGTSGWSTFGYSDGESYNTLLNNQLNYPNVMYSFHFYADSHGDNYLNILNIVSDQVPVFVTEFGFQNAAGEGTNNRIMTDKYITLMRNKKISWCNWNFSDDNRSGAVWKTGTCSSNNWSNNNLKESGLWIKEYISNPVDDFGVTPPPNNSSTLIQAEDYLYMSGIQTEPTTDAGGGLNVGYANTGDWMAYNSVNFTVTGLYLIEYRVASAVNGARLSADLNAGTIQLGAVNLPNTGGWQNWQTISHTVNINAGSYNFGIYIQNSGVNLNWIRITKVNNVISRLASSNEEIILYPNPVENSLNFTTDMSNSKVTIINIETGVITNLDVQNKNNIDVTGLKPGVYSIVIETEGKKERRKFVKK